jgi:hypothetical protein
LRKADIILADLTFAAKTKAVKNLPNANVVFELGYAARHLGFRSLVAVMNTAFGSPKGRFSISSAVRAFVIAAPRNASDRDENQEARERIGRRIYWDDP